MKFAEQGTFNFHIINNHENLAYEENWSSHLDLHELNIRLESA